MPAQDDVLGYFSTLSNWGRWGDEDELGTLNHVTHLDSPCHVFWDGTMYNGRPHSLAGAATGSAWAAVTAAADGIITRGVLLDIAGARGVPWLEPGQGVFPGDLGQWDFHLAVAPVRFAGTSGSPVNPIATF